MISWCRITRLCYIRGQPSRAILIVNCGEFILTKEKLSLSEKAVWEGGGNLKKKVGIEGKHTALGGFFGGFFFYCTLR